MTSARVGLWAPLAIVLGALAPTAALAQSGTQFFADKTLRFIVATAAGGGYDFRMRAMARHIGKLLPGKPNIIVENMPGGGSIIGANYTYSVAPKDGTVMCMIQRSVFTTLFEKPAAARFDLKEFIWLGNMGPDNGVVVSWHTTPFKTAADLLTGEMVVAMPSGTYTQPQSINSVIGTRMKIIAGYPGATEMQLAMERGEVAGIGDISWSNVKQSRPAWLKEGKVNLLFQIGLKKEPDLPHVPLPQEFTKTAEDRQVLDVVASQRQFAYAIVLPPGVPADRVAMLQKAFMDLEHDAAFKADMAKLGYSFEPMHGEELAKAVRGMTASLTPAMIERIQKSTAPPRI